MSDIKTYRVKGMHCASCAGIIEKTFKKTEGVHSAEVLHECGLDYKEAGWMKKCKAWCKKYKSYDLEIISYVIRN